MTAAVDEVPQAFGTQADFARAQKWQKSYVTKLKNEGRLVFDEQGRVDFAASLERIRASTEAPERAAPAVQGRAYTEAQDREKFYTAELKRLEYEREIGKLREASEMLSVLDDAAAVFRTGVESWAARMPAQLAACGGDEQRIAALLASEGEQLLRRVAEKFSAMAAREVHA